jgi:glycine cleavage system regulatory protein
MGLALLRDVVRNLREGGELPARRQDEQFATRAPMIRRTVTLSEAKEAIPSSLVATVIGPDRPGIVRQISERAKGFGANWTASRMSSLGSQFAGIVQFEVAPEHAEGLTVALRGLESAGLQVAIARSDSAPPPPGRRIVALEMTGVDRPGIVRELSSGLAERGVSIEDLHTEVVNGATAAEHQFRVKAVLFVPNTVRNEELRNALKALATEMKIDLALDEYEAG